MSDETIKENQPKFIEKQITQTVRFYQWDLLERKRVLEEELVKINQLLIEII